MSIVVEPLPVLSLPPASSSSFATTPPKLPPRPPPKLQTVMRVESVSFNSGDLIAGVISPPLSPIKSNQSQANNSVVSPFRFKDHEHGNTEYMRVPSRTSSNMSFTNTDTNFYYANLDYTNKGTFLFFLAAIPFTHRFEQIKKKRINSIIIFKLNNYQTYDFVCFFLLFSSNHCSN
jgi:hypothetical protein